MLVGYKYGKKEKVSLFLKHSWETSFYGEIDFLKKYFNIATYM